jgi:hypothetical protein
VGQYFFVVPVEEQPAFGIAVGPIFPRLQICRLAERAGRIKGLDVLCWKGGDMESGRLPTHVSIGRPLAAVILTAVFFSGSTVAVVCSTVAGGVGFTRTGAFVSLFLVVFFTGPSLQSSFPFSEELPYFLDLIDAHSIGSSKNHSILHPLRIQIFPFA